MPLKSRYNSSLSGRVNYGYKVVESIISLATLEIRGVAWLQGKKIRTEWIGELLNVDVYIEVFVGFSCAEVAYRVQQNIKRSVESMTAHKVGLINVNILGVSFDEIK